jgi:hypothetical protein
VILAEPDQCVKGAGRLLLYLILGEGSQLQEIATLRKVDFTAGGGPCDDFTVMRQTLALDLADAGGPNE